METLTATWCAEQRALPHISEMEAYVPGLQPNESGWLKLNTNELPYPISPRVGEAVNAEMARIHLYPNPTSRPLREAIARYHGLDASQVIVGNGSDDLLNLLARAFAGKGQAAAMTMPSYSLYPVLAAIQNAHMEYIPFTRSMELPVRDIAACGANLFYLTSPNAPTGVQFDLNVIYNAVSFFRGVFVIDEAYVDYADHNAVELLRELPNLVITRTFSKSYGLAGLRVGYGLASPGIIEILDRVRDSYNVNRLSQAGAKAAIEDKAHYRPIIAKICQTRDAFIDSLRGRGWFAYESHANFVFGEPANAAGQRGPAVAKSLFDYLNAHKVLVRYFTGNALTESGLRISVGTDAQMATLLDHIDTWRKTA